MGALRERPAQYGPVVIGSQHPLGVPPKETSQQSKALLATASPHKQDRLTQNAGALYRPDGLATSVYGSVTAGPTATCCGEQLSRGALIPSTPA
jgi:hypothetical protein